MKLNKVILSGVMALTGAFTLASCADDLEPAPNGSLDMNEVLTDPVKVSALLARCYKYIPQKGNVYLEFTNLPSELTDEGHSTADGSPAHHPCVQIYNDSHSAVAHPIITNDGHPANGKYDWIGIGHYWERYWSQIFQCNQFLELIDQANVTDDPTADAEAIRARYKAEAHVLRAYFYSELIRWYGKVPVVKATGGLDQDFSVLKRQPVKEVVDFIIEDCNFALNTPSLPWRVTTEGEKMRCTKAVACGLISRMTLVAASPLFNEGQDYWKWAYDENLRVTKLLTDNGYELFKQATKDQFGNTACSAYRQLMCTNSDYSANPIDKETIWQHARHDTHQMWHINYVCADFDNTAYAGLIPTQEMVDAFETTDGEPVLDLANPYLDEKHLEPNYNKKNTLYDPQNPYVNRDPRFESMVIYNGKSVLWGETWRTIETFEGGKEGISFDLTDRRYTRTGYYLCKYVAPDINGSGQGKQNYYTKGDNMQVRWRLLRLGEVFLNLAEAANEAGQTADALKYLNEVRARVQMPAVTATDKEQLRLRIHNERRVELAFEETRYFDLRRWSKPDGDLKKYHAWPTAMVITKNADGSFSYERRNVWNKERGGCNNRDLLLPLEQAEANRLLSLTGVDWQNPGW